MIEVVAYDANWTRIFEAESRRIRQALGDNCIAIHHIGSTSVPNLAAKPIIDMIPVVLNIVEVDSCNQQMKELGYEPKGEYGMPFRRYFQKKMSPKFHVHVFEKGNSEIDRHLKFRDYLRHNAIDREVYAELKKQLASQFANDSTLYCLNKDGFIASIAAKAGWNGMRTVIAATAKEWQAYHRIREEQLFAPSGIAYNPNHPTISAENHFHFVLYRGVEIVSIAQVEFLNAKEAALRSLATDRPYKNQGFAKALLLQLERWIKQHGKSIIRLHANPTADGFYRKLGYIEMPFDDQSVQANTINLAKEI